MFILFCALTSVFFLSMIYILYSPVRKRSAKANVWIESVLVSKKRINYNTSLYRFELGKYSALNLQIGQHISVRANIDGKLVSRSYTPINPIRDISFVDLLIKTYPSGRISKYVDNLKLGDKLELSGPKGNFFYRRNMVSKLCMLAGGTGITPMWQIANEILNDKKDKTEMVIMYANVSQSDILLRDEMDELSKLSNGRLSIIYFLEKPPNNWNYEVGYISSNSIAQYCSTVSTRVLICGPPPMVKAMAKSCGELGYPLCNTVSKGKDIVYKF